MNILEAPVMMENHDQALQAWQQAGIQQAVLVHVDAHIDFGWIPQADLDEIDPDAPQPMLNPLVISRRTMLTIGNYICPAVWQGIVRKFYWVVPEASMSSRRGRRFIVRQLKRLVPGSAGKPVRVQAGALRCELAGCELIVCTLGALERINEPVLLDIDVDFLLTPRIWNDLEPGRLPWIMPEELLKRLSEKTAVVRMLTIAYSVEGGYTPLRFKYLGDELAQLSAGKEPVTAALKRRALAHERRGQWQQAGALYCQAGTCDPSDASIPYTLCSLFLEQGVGDVGSAAAGYRRCVALDRSYATSYNNRGILYLQQGRIERARKAFTDFLEIDGQNPSVFNGLGHICLAKKNYSQAAGWFDRCLAQERTHAAALLGKALALMQAGSPAEAVTLLEELARLRPDDPQSYYWLGRICQRRNNVTAAADRFKQAVMRGWTGPGIHVRLAWLCLQRRMFVRCREECCRAIEEWLVCR